MEHFYHVTVAFTNSAAYLPFAFAYARGKTHDWLTIAAAAVWSFAYHLSLAAAPQYSESLLWADRAAATAAVMHFLYRLCAVCPYDVGRALQATWMTAGTGLLCLFVSDVLLAMQPTLAWCLFHGVWHICAFFTARRLQDYVYRAEDGKGGR